MLFRRLILFACLTFLSTAVVVVTADEKSKKMTRGQSGSASYGKMMNNNKKYGGDYRRHIHVTGQASAGATPDLATFTVGVNTEAETAAQAVDENSIIMNDILQVLRTAPYSIDEADLQTARFNVNQRFSGGAGGCGGKMYGAPIPGCSDEATISYFVDNSLRVKVRNLDQLGDIMDAVLQAGATTVDNVTFGFTEDTAASLDVQAHRDAVHDAHQRADWYAKSAGVTLGPLVELTQQTADVCGGKMYGGKYTKIIAASLSVCAPIYCRLQSRYYVHLSHPMSHTLF